MPKHNKYRQTTRKTLNRKKRTTLKNRKKRTTKGINKSKVYCKYCHCWHKNIKGTRKQKGSGGVLDLNKETWDFIYSLIDKAIEIFTAWLENLQKNTKLEYLKKEIDNIDFFDLRTLLIKKTEKAIILYLDNAIIDENNSDDEVDKKLHKTINEMLPTVIHKIFKSYMNDTFRVIYSRLINNIDPDAITNLHTKIETELSKIKK